MAEPRLRNILARHVLRDLEGAGIATAPLLARSGLRRAQLNRDEGWIPYRGHALFLEAAAAATGNPFFGIELARRFDPRDLGTLAYIGLSCRTLEDALLNLERYMSVQTEAWRLDLVFEGDAAILSLEAVRPDLRDLEQAAESTVASLVYGYQFFLSEPLGPREIRFAHRRRDDKPAQRYQELLGCPVIFGGESCHILIDRDAMRRQITTADDRLLAILQAYCKEVLKHHAPGRSDLVLRIQQGIVDLLPSGRARAKVVAGNLGMTERTMHRRLAAENTGFGQIHERLRRDLALKYVLEERLNLQQIAYLLGYSDQSAFSVAFRRWTDRTPSEMRQEG
jgi:AraC-like DNA-binding protein